MQQNQALRLLRYIWPHWYLLSSDTHPTVGGVVAVLAYTHDAQFWRRRHRVSARSQSGSSHAQAPDFTHSLPRRACFVILEIDGAGLKSLPRTAPGLGIRAGPNLLPSERCPPATNQHDRLRGAGAAPRVHESLPAASEKTRSSRTEFMAFRRHLV